MINTVYLIGGARTPIGKTGGILRDYLPERLAAIVLNRLIHQYRIPNTAVDQVILGNAVGPGGNIARVSVLEAGWSYDIPATTVDSQCGSGLSAVQLAVSQIRAGEADIILAGGTESTSMAPRRQFSPLDPRFQGETVFYEQAPFSPDAIGNPPVGEAAENLARHLNISREAMDLQAVHSHQTAAQTAAQGLLSDIIIPLACRGKTIQTDECIRKHLSRKLLSRMKPAFVPDGAITAGNTCLKHDGAAALLIASPAAVKKFHLTPQAVIRATASRGCDPNLFPLAPVGAIQKLSEKSALPLHRIDAIEINEAFAVKILACCQKLGIGLEKVNRLGGALAYGHPYGASGAIILLHLLKSLEQCKGRYGVAAIGAVGGMGTAILLERC
ncbi:hypothetical protein P22_0879 [Propionispora sp. 2/2-37]|uniref:thiolase family protein n=1 Tax=Propionispora sp. 2/2-37 TaxID=1677858 RepID=UPI0006C6173D|nr:thiolase family protein [Propionispora sp. 2/2-37]CUH94813.1 hypothetical protein P22_0879 [Propionispora sp. 2/2-37]